MTDGKEQCFGCRRGGFTSYDSPGNDWNKQFVQCCGLLFFPSRMRCKIKPETLGQDSLFPGHNNNNNNKTPHLNSMCLFRLLYIWVSGINWQEQLKWQGRLLGQRTVASVRTRRRKKFQNTVKTVARSSCYSASYSLQRNISTLRTLLKQFFFSRLDFSMKIKGFVWVTTQPSHRLNHILN